MSFEIFCKVKLGEGMLFDLEFTNAVVFVVHMVVMGVKGHWTVCVDVYNVVCC